MLSDLSVHLKVFAKAHRESLAGHARGCNRWLLS